GLDDRVGRHAERVLQVGEVDAGIGERGRLGGRRRGGHGERADAQAGRAERNREAGGERLPGSRNRRGHGEVLVGEVGVMGDGMGTCRRVGERRSALTHSLHHATVLPVRRRTISYARNVITPRPNRPPRMTRPAPEASATSAGGAASRTASTSGSSLGSAEGAAEGSALGETLGTISSPAEATSVRVCSSACAWVWLLVEDDEEDVVVEDDELDDEELAGCWAACFVTSHLS